MSRIRSIHPGLFTDEEYMALSFPARELVKGLWVEADDQGVFEWKLLTIKARIMPADAVDMAALMEELVERRFIRQFSADGKTYGAVRNFRVFQRPKKPNPIHPLPHDVAVYVGLDGTSSEQVPHLEEEPVRNQFPTGGEKSPQMEDVECRKENIPSSLRSDETAEAVERAPEGEDLKTRIFTKALTWLAKQSDKPPDKLRPLVGKWCSRYGDKAVLDAFNEAKSSSPVDPVSWIERTLSNGKAGETNARSDQELIAIVAQRRGITLRDGVAGGAGGDANPVLPAVSGSG